MGNFVMPKHTGVLEEFTVPLKVCYEKRNENEGWMPNGNAVKQEEGFTYSIFQEYRRRHPDVALKTDNSDYTKDAQIPLYLGFLEGRGHDNAEKRITPKGVKMYEAIVAEDTNAQYELLIDAFETKTFGRNNQGFPSSDSDVEVPNVLLLSSIFLGGIKRPEFYYILYLMHTNGWDLARAVANVIYLRKGNKDIPNVPGNFTDCKLIPLFVSMKFLFDDKQKGLFIAPDVYNDYAKRILDLRSKNNEVINTAIKQDNMDEVNVDSCLLQQIYYGAPGTGKSREIKEQTEGRAVVRTTFHPDSDYSTFVGSYKPVMQDVDVPVVPVVVNSGIGLKPSGSYTEKRITYKFVKQAFLKAYLGAWKKYSDKQTRVSLPLAYTFKIKKNEYTIKGVDNTGILIHRVFPFDISSKNITKVWNDIWSSGSFDMPTGGQSGVSVQQAIATWIRDNVQGCTSRSLDEGLESLKKCIEASGKVSISKEGNNCQTYVLSRRGDDYVIDVDSTCSKIKIEEYYNGQKPKLGKKDLQDYFANFLQKIDRSSFNNAWDRLADAIKGKKSEIDLQREESVVESQFLVIEEINRGNCAQIFGDLFQLLDRGDNGFSEYPIEADTDLQREIENAFKNDKNYQLENDIDVEGAVANYTSNYENEDGTRYSLSEDIQAGRILLLPNNLYIWATMNTSDQSLFPIDSAFKRRWKWIYMKIKKGKDEDGNDLDWRIVIKDKDENVVKINDKESLLWWDFIDKINDIIASMTSSADKQLGYFFCKADNEGIINADTLVNKVVFYLWNDVFKDYGFEDASLFQYKVKEGDKEVTKDLTFPDFFDEEGENVNEVRLKGFLESVMNWKKNEDQK